MTGRLFKLDRDVTIIGRNPDCDVVLQPKSVSRKHAAIVRKPAGFEIKDLGSTRGTLVNGQKLTEPVVLKDGNTLQIGEVLLSFTSRVVQIEEGDDEQSTVYAAIDVLNQSDRHFPLVKPEAKFRALRLIGQELGGTLVLSEVLDRIFNSLFEIFPRAERGFVLLKDPARTRCMPEIIRSRTGPAGELKISKTVLNRVLNGGQAILCKDLAQEFPESASVSDSKIRSLMCVPLFDQDRQSGRDHADRHPRRPGPVRAGRPRPAGGRRQPDQRGRAERPVAQGAGQAARDGARAPVCPPGDAVALAGAARPRSRATSSGRITSRPATSAAIITGSSPSPPERADRRPSPPGGRSPSATSWARECRRPC